MLAEVLHPVNFYAGWSLVLLGFLTGAGVGLMFHREDFWGGYGSFRRRLVRLGHVALVMLGILNVLFSISVPGSTRQGGASILFLFGAVAMPTVCFVTAWRAGFRNLFFIPVLALVGAVVLILLGGAL